MFSLLSIPLPRLLFPHPSTLLFALLSSSISHLTDFESAFSFLVPTTFSPCLSFVPSSFFYNS